MSLAMLAVAQVQKVETTLAYLVQATGGAGFGVGGLADGGSACESTASCITGNGGNGSTLLVVMVA